MRFRHPNPAYGVVEREFPFATLPDGIEVGARLRIEVIINKSDNAIAFKVQQLATSQGRCRKSGLEWPPLPVDDQADQIYEKAVGRLVRASLKAAAKSRR